MNEIKIILLCSSRFALPVLREMIFFKQVAVVAVPRSSEEIAEQLEFLLKDAGVPLLLVDKEHCSEQLMEAIQQYNISAGLVMTFGYKISAKVFTMPANGFFNVHPGPLPSYRGADPIFQQIKNRELHAAVTIHKVDEGMDTGPVVMQEMIRLEKEDTSGLLNTKLATVAARLVANLLKMISLGLAVPSRPQDLSKVVYYKKQSAKDIVINWQSMDAATIVALINACNPWNKGAVTKLNGNIVRLLEAETISILPETAKAAGTIIAFEKEFIIISTINDQAIRVGIIYIDEGFLMAVRLKQLGIHPGSCFEMV
ncbi:MAG: formyltransferase family protein [Ferruginibacter sp.]